MKTKIEKINGSSFISLDNEKGFEVILCSFGAGIYDIKVDGKTMLLSPYGYENYMNAKCYFGKTCGRFAGRIKDGITTINGKTYHISLNEPTNALHGGAKGYSYIPYQYNINDNEVTFILDDKEDELPGDVKVAITYVVSKDSNELTIKYDAISTKDTILNLTGHAYFNLSGDLASNVEDHKFYLGCNKYGILDDKLIFTGEALVDKVTDFRDFHEISKYINDPSINKDPTMGYDHLFIKENFNDDVIAKLYCKSSNILLTITSDYKAIVCYSYNYPLNDMLFIPGKKVKARYGLALEPQNLPMSVNSNYFNENILKANQRYNHYIKYSFTKEA